jgi:ABC-type Mn2+/Zn2+ transport system ATPase subunit
VTVAVSNLRVDRGGTEILHGVSFEVSSGDLVTITGSNGAGKTTLIKAILGILPYSSGTVLLDGVAVGSSVWRGHRRRVGYVSQHAVQTDFPISVSEVVSIGLSTERHSRRERHERMDRAMDLTGCLRLRKATYAPLSGGEKQRVSIARCLCQNPAVMVLDEPIASLDPEGKEAIVTLTEEVSASLGITVLLVSHESAHFGRSGWRRIALENGRIVSDTEARGA